MVGERGDKEEKWLQMDKKREFCDGNILLHLNCGGNFTVRENALTYAIKWVQLITCKLHLIKLIWKKIFLYGHVNNINEQGIWECLNHNLQKDKT
jgi:S-adenosylmethionine synthetase